jgi:OmpA-OmpF porin, OOP family
MSDLLKGIMSHVTPSLVQNLAGKLGESESGVTKAIGGLAPTLLAGLIGKSSDTSAMSGIFNMLTDKKSSGMLDGIGSMVSSGSFMQAPASNDMASGFVNSLFGNKTSGIMSAVSNFSGLKQGSTSSLMGLVAPLVMGFLSKKILGGGMNLSSLTSLLGSEKSSIMAALPGGMGNMLGLSSGISTPNVPKASSKMPLILGLLAGAAALFFLWKGCNKPTVEVPKVEVPTIQMDTVAKKVEAVVDNTAGAITGFFRKLSSGFELKGESAGIERNLVEFVESDKVVDKTTWFNFDRLNFKTGSAELDMDKSKDQLVNMSEILKAFPKVNLKVGGYTDNTGNAASNVKLSNSRAEAVVAALVGMGADKTRLEAEGYGDQHPIGDNATEEGRAQNRRIAVRVTAK